MIELLDQGDFPDRSGWRPFFGVEVNLLQGNQLINLVVSTFMDLIFL